MATAPPPAHVPRLHVDQRITLVVNRYRVLAVNPDGSHGRMLAFAEQKRFRLKEEVLFYRDESKRDLAFSFKARQRLDVHAEHDVLDEHGMSLGYFKKEFGASLLRSTWTLGARGLHARGRERNQAVAVLRRVWTLVPYLGDLWVPFLFHFDFVDTTSGEPVMTSERVVGIRDRYAVTVPDPRLDWRVAAAMAVALDALQSR